ncbi:retinol-binding protein pinta isoform X1 [Leptinotarsa decemlineata]|uniref:retinol-binding protein pinta isoform X1 n=1 Tax=Leptinotarsa decemlineata TaxID=7539 RepID=UPI003D306A37
MVDVDHWLTSNREEVLKVSLESLGRTDEELKEYVSILTEWLETQPHLPEKPSENVIINIVLMNKFSIEKCKQRLDMYYTIRNLLPEIYGKMDSKMTMKIADDILFFPLPKRTVEQDRINIVKLKDIETNDFDIYTWMGYCYNVLDLRLSEDICTAEIIVNDLEFFKLSHITKITPVHIKKIVMILEKVYSNRIKQFHFVNCPPFAYNILNSVKSLMKPKLAARIFFHEDCSKIGDIIPLEVLPKDYGGSELSLYDLNELWKKKLEQYSTRFNNLSKMKTNEILRPSPLVNDEVLGFHGNFRKLEMD